MLRFRREVGSGTVNALTLWRAAHRIERSLVTGSHTCGCGFWSGCGKTLSSLRVVVEAMMGLPTEYMSGGPTLSTSSTLRPALGMLKYAMVALWFHLVCRGGNDQNSPWCEKDGCVQAFMMISKASSKYARLRSWSWMVEP